MTPRRNPIRTDGTEHLVLAPYDELLRNLVSLNEIVAGLVRGLSLGERPEPEWVDLVVTTLKEQQWRLGFEFEGQRPSAEWLFEEENRR